MKVVINSSYGGFSISKKALYRLRDLGSLEVKKYMKDYFSDENEIEADTWDMFYVCSNDEWRADPLLIQVVEELGEKASGRYSDLKIIEILDDIEWHISEYDGMETVHENHGSWG